MTKRVSLLSSTLVLLVVVATSWARPAGATTAIQLDLESLVANSDRIVVGDVTEIESFRRDGTILTDVTIDVADNWKGDGPDTITVRHPGGRVGDLVTHVPGTPTFRTDQRIAIFLERRDEGIYVPTGLAQGAFRVVTGPDGATRFVVPEIGDLNLVSPLDDATSATEGDRPSKEGPVRLKTRLQSAGPSDLHEAPMSFETFRQRVQSTVRDQETAP
jgi:hypothetical protein